MAVKPVLSTIIKKFSGKPLSVVSKTLAVATTASVIYDAHINGKQNALIENQKNMSERLHKQYIQRESMNRDSPTLAKLKNMWFDQQQKFTCFEIADNIKGYSKGVGKTVADNAFLIGLSAIALKFKNVGKVAGVLLGVNAVKVLASDVFGIGNSKNIK